jgi:hypothetical protein
METLEPEVGYRVVFSPELTKSESRFRAFCHMFGVMDHKITGVDKKERKISIFIRPWTYWLSLDDVVVLPP